MKDEVDSWDAPRARKGRGPFWWINLIVMVVVIGPFIGLVPDLWDVISARRSISKVFSLATECRNYADRHGGEMPPHPEALSADAALLLREKGFEYFPGLRVGGDPELPLVAGPETRGGRRLVMRLGGVGNVMSAWEYGKVTERYRQWMAQSNAEAK